MPSHTQLDSGALAILFGSGVEEFLEQRKGWREGYASILQQIGMARDNGEISNALLKDLWWTRANGVATIKTGAMGLEGFEQVQEELRALAMRILADCSEESYRTAIATFKEFKARGVVAGVLYAVINRVFAAAHPDKCTTAVAPKLFRELASQINERFSLELSGEKANWLQSNMALKTAINRVKPDSFDDVDTNIAIWRFHKDSNPQGFDEMESPNDEAAAEPSAELASGAMPLNQILFGPPGTGKTYETTSLAVQIADPEWFAAHSAAESSPPTRAALKQRYDELVAEKRVVFTTFHQSFAYEDFIEGIRAETDEQGALQYPIQEGVFKQLCDAADAKVTRQSGEAIYLKGRKVWKMSLGNTLAGEEDIYQECLENSYVLLGYGEAVDFSQCNDRDSVRAQFEASNSREIVQSDYPITSVHMFKNQISNGDIVVVSDGNNKFRAIGEIIGDYQFLSSEERPDYRQARQVKWHRQYEPSLPREQLFKKSLSQMTLYELRPSTVDMDKLAQLLAPKDVHEQEQRPYVLIIDEINRGNISRIFGELITLLEPAKRKGADDAREVILPYSKEPFSVPTNVYVIGTMNTADKSLAQLDLALRRRFSFTEMPPRAELLTGVRVYGVDMGEMLAVINQRIEVLLDRDHLIGHSYFMPILNASEAEEREAELASIFENGIIPLLQEYFFDDWQRISWVLNDPAKAENDRFIRAGGKQNLSVLFATEVAEQISDRRFYVNTKTFTQAAAYSGILPSGAGTIPAPASAEYEAKEA